MKTLFFATALFLSTMAVGQDTLRVLFLGNSYTGVNNLPQLVADLAYSAGDTLIFDSYTPGGYTLNAHYSNVNSWQLISQGNWDFVVLQEQSQLPSFPIAQVNTDCFPYATALDTLIRATNPCAETMFYNTWGRENGDTSNCANWPPVCTYEGMDDLLRERYDQMAVDNEGVISPVGPLWRYIRTNSPGLQLYAADGSHPSMAGSYAAACTFYSALYRKDPTLITSDAGLPAMDALTIRTAAKAVVYDSLATWHIGEYDPVAGFDFTTSYWTASFIDTSQNADNYFWDFGDGQTSTQQNPIHIYSNTGSYMVTLTVESCGLTDVFIDTLYPPFHNIGLTEFALIKEIYVSPNPATEKVFVPIKKLDKLSVFNSEGKEMDFLFAKKDEGYEIDFASLSAGVYWLKIESEGKFFHAKVVKEE